MKYSELIPPTKRLASSAMVLAGIVGLGLAITPPKSVAAVTVTTPAPAADQIGQITISYVVANGNIDQQVQTDQITGAVGANGTYVANTPGGYALAAGQPSTVNFTFQASAQTLYVYVTPANQAPTGSSTSTPLPTGSATITVLLDDGSVLTTQTMSGSIGKKIAYNIESLLSNLAAAGYQVTQNTYDANAEFTASPQNFTVTATAPATVKTPEILQRQPMTVPAQPVDPTTVKAPKVVTPLIDPVIQPQGNEFGELSDHRLHAPILLNHPLFPQVDIHHGGGADMRSGLAGYFIALSGRINFGICR